MRYLALLGCAALACSAGTPPSGPAPVAPDTARPPLATAAAPRAVPSFAPAFAVDSLMALNQFLDARVADGAFPGGVLIIGTSGGVVHSATYGTYGHDDGRPVTDSTIYDLASLTKVVGLTTLAYLLMAEGRLHLDDRVQAYLPDFAGAHKDSITIRHLLTHSSGLPAWIPLYQETKSRDEALERVVQTELEHPPGSTYVYSDIGAITMMLIIERITGIRFDDYLEYRVLQPLGMRDTGFVPDSSRFNRVAPTERDPWRGRVVLGEVHDENAYHLGGVSGHAGLFSTGHDLARFAVWLLRAHHGTLPEDAEPSLPADLVRRLTSVQPGPEGSTRAIGWDTPTPGGGLSSGQRLSPASFGHTGFTGTSIWIDPQRDLFIILLTNRVHPTRENRALLPIRGQVADFAVGAVRGPNGEMVPRGRQP